MKAVARRDGRVVEGGGLENRFPVLRNGGSNPSPSATIALLRGINNVGSRRVTMADLKAAFGAMGFRKVRTVLTSGNVVFEAPGRAPDPGRTIALGLEEALGFPVIVLIRSVRELQAIIRSEPFAAQPSGPEVQQYVTFIGGKGRARPSVLSPDPPKGTRIVRVDQGEIYSVVLLSRGGKTPDLMNYLDRTFGPAGTTRNWRTILKIVGPDNGPSH
jgi:uncharacterized protein (DUF1697 family)